MYTINKSNYISFINNDSFVDINSKIEDATNFYYFRIYPICYFYEEKQILKLDSKGEFMTGTKNEIVKFNRKLYFDILKFKYEERIFKI